MFFQLSQQGRYYRLILKTTKLKFGGWGQAEVTCVYLHGSGPKITMCLFWIFPPLFQRA